jgi:ankyrin repeat protein
MNNIRLYFQTIFFVASFSTTALTGMIVEKLHTYNHQSHEKSGFLNTLGSYAADNKKRQEKLFRDAAQRNNQKQIIKSIKEGINVNAQEDGTCNAALHWATFHGHIETGNTLLQHGANVNITNNTGSTPLHIAIANQNIPYIHLLLGYDADMTIKNAGGYRPDAYITWNNTGGTPHKGIYTGNHFVKKAHPIILNARLEQELAKNNGCQLS